MNDDQSEQLNPFPENLKQGVWFFGAASSLFGIIDRSIASFADGYLSASELVQLAIISFFFISWLFLKPARQLKIETGDEG